MEFLLDRTTRSDKGVLVFPLIGLLVGVLSGILGDLCIYMELPIFLSCVTAIIFSVIVTGAFHEDGLADMADGFGAEARQRELIE